MVQNNSYIKIKEYFENLVEKSLFLKSFSGFFLRELHDLQADGLDGPCLALYDYSLGIEGAEQSSTAVRKVGFAIFIDNVPPDDFEAQYNAIDLSEQLALKVVARMKFDSNNPKHLLYNSLIKNSVEIRPIEIQGDGLFGTEVTLNLNNFQTMKLNPDEWSDIESVC